MPEIQEQLLKRYQNLMNDPTLREIAADTGIQLTRIFRLFNGSEMRLKEYLLFKNRVADLEGIESDLLALVGKLEKGLPSNRLQKLKRSLSRELMYSQLLDQQTA